MGGSLPHSSVHGILQAKILEWVAIPFSRGFSDSGIKPRSHALQVNSSALKRKAILTCATTWIKLEDVMPSEISQLQKEK